MPRTFTGKIAPSEESAKVPHPKFAGEIHEVYILDGSSSMAHGNYLINPPRPTKFENGVVGINADLTASKKQSAELSLNTTYSICQFGLNYNHATPGNILRADIGNFKNYSPTFLRAGGTALYTTIIEVVNIVLAFKKHEDKVLLKITTDGRNNVSGHMVAPCAALLKKVQEEDNFTVTFVGTQEDVDHVTHNLNIDESNTLVYDNTSEGLEKALSKTAKMSSVYRKDVYRGADVSTNFYSKSM